MNGPMRKAEGFPTRRWPRSTLFLKRSTGNGTIQQLPENLRRNVLPVKLINRSLLMRHEHLAGALVELSEMVKTSSRTNGVLHHAPEAFDGVAVMSAVSG